MNRKFSFLLAIPIVIGVAIIVWSLLTGIMAKSTSSMSLYVSLRTMDLQHFFVCNNSVSFEMAPDSEGDFTFSVDNNGTFALRNVTLYIDRVSNELSLIGGGKAVSPPFTSYIGSLPIRDGTGRIWKVLSPHESGDYEIDFRVVSDRVAYWFTVVIKVHS